MAKDVILLIGANGQLGSELGFELQKIYGEQNVVKTDLYYPENKELANGIFHTLDVLDKGKLFELVGKYKITQIYQLAALLSAKCELKPKSSWNLNINGLLNVLDCAYEMKIAKIFWPSSIAVFGPTSPKNHTPQQTIIEPSTIYGMSKLAGELWCEYYHNKYQIDVRSIRYPGVIGYKSLPGGGTTDYAVDIFHYAVRGETYTCFLKPETFLPMIYMPDAINATLSLMSVEAQKVKIHSGYNISSMSFSPEVLSDEIRKILPEFTCLYQPDFRQALADSWPKSIDDTQAREHWGWKPKFELPEMVKDMIYNLNLAKSTYVYTAKS